MIPFLLELPIVVMALSIIGTTVVLALSIVEIIHRSPLAKLKPSFRNMNPSLGGAMMAGYVIFSALIANTLWRENEFAQQAVLQEARSLSFAARMVDAQRYPELGLSIAAYAKAVTQQEWQTMSGGIENASARQILDSMHRTVLNGLPGLPDEMRKLMLTTLKEVEIARQNRLMAATDSIPGEMWLTVVLTALVVLFFSAFSHQHDPVAARMMAILFGVMIGSMMFSIIAIDRAFIGKVSVSNAPIVRLWENHLDKPIR